MNFIEKTLLFLALCSGLAANPPSDKVQVAPKINGKWQLINERIDKIGMKIEWEFTETEMIVRDINNGEELSRSRYAVNTEKSPHWITLEINDSLDEKGEDQRLGIFRFLDGELHIKFEITDGGLRPEGFEGGFSRYKPLPLSDKTESE
jgi:uncharacterized protein (TIGR03067 family)